MKNVPNSGRKSKGGGNAGNARAAPVVRLRFFLPKKNPVKLTALLYLREALQEERYEECAYFIEVAKEFGASLEEIRLLLEDARRLPKS